MSPAANKRPIDGPSKMAPQPKRRFMQLEEETDQRVASGFDRYRGVRRLPSDTPAGRMNVVRYERSSPDSELTANEIVEILEDGDSRSLERPYAPFFGDYSDEEFLRGISAALKLKRELDMLEEERKMIEGIVEEEPPLRGPVFIKKAFRPIKKEEEPKKENSYEEGSGREEEAKDQDEMRSYVDEEFSEESCEEPRGGKEEDSDEDWSEEEEENEETEDDEYVDCGAMQVTAEDVVEEEVVDDGAVYFDAPFEITQGGTTFEHNAVFFDTDFEVAIEEEVITTD